MDRDSCARDRERRSVRGSTGASEGEPTEGGTTGTKQASSAGPRRVRNMRIRTGGNEAEADINVLLLPLSRFAAAPIRRRASLPSHVDEGGRARAGRVG